MAAMKAADAMQVAGTLLLRKAPYYGALALRLKKIPDPTCRTAYTDGVVIGYNPDWIETLTRSQLVGLLAHEVSHVALGHCWRRGNRNPKRWNAAADYQINGDLQKAGFDLPDGALLEPAFDGLSTEAIYARLPDEGDEGGEDGDGGTGYGDVRDAPADAGPGHTEAGWKQAVAAAAEIARQQGNLPAGMARLLEKKLPDCRDLIAALLAFVERTRSRDDYTWSRPSRRWLHQGIYLPAMEGTSCPPLVAGVDTSGSISQELLGRYLGALQVVMDEIRPERLVIYDCDAIVHQRVEVERGGEIDFKPKGGGGTRFEPVFAEVERQGDEPCCAIYLTDLCGSFPKVPPPYPVLWVVSDPYGRQAAVPFGETIYVEE